MAPNELTLEDVRAAIAQAGTRWVADETSVSDMSDEQFKRMLGAVPGPNDPPMEERERVARLNAASPLAMEPPPGVALDLPAAWDWRDVDGRNYVTPVKHQGDCGSCTAFGTAATVESGLKIALQDPDLDVDLSEAHLYFCYARRDCERGMWPPEPLDAIRDHGVVDESCYPYVGRKQDCNVCGDANTRLTFIDSWRRYVTTASMKIWLTSMGPLIACFSVYSDFRRYRSGVYTQVTGEYEGGHTVSVIGYDDNDGCWICKNSWGTGWGNNGFFRIGYGECGIDSEMWTAEGARSWGPINEAVFVQQTVPAAVRAGQQYNITVIMRNTGLQTWTNARGYGLISQSPEGNSDWGVANVALPGQVRPWQDVTFQFPLTAPAPPAHLQWRMNRNGVGSFGATTPDVVVAAEAAPVRFGAVMKLRHAVTGCALHSHAINYSHPGSSGQQQVTCFEGADANDYWLFKGPDGQPEDFQFGQPIQHGATIRLQHLATGRNLHSHAGFPSPVTFQQEVTGYGTAGIGDANDNWQVEVDGGGPWVTGRAVRLIHLGTNAALHSHAGFSNPAWTAGQQEVTGFDGRDANDLWFASDLRAHDARFAGQTVPASLVVGQTQGVSVTMRNVGTETWTAANSYRLGSQSPADNQIWGLGRVEMPHPVPPGDTVTFAFDITAPAGFTRAPFHWQMLQEGVEWFGDTSQRVQIPIFQQAGPTTVPDVVGMARVLAGNTIRATELVPQFSGAPGNTTEVDRQTPPAGTSVARGTTVQLHMIRLV
jgi:C1A family cysteine protease